MGELDLQTLGTARPPQDRAIKTFPQDRQAKRDLLLARIDEIGPTLQETGGKSEELATLAPEAVAALRSAGMFRLKLPAVLGGAEVDPVTEMLVLERLAYFDFTNACTMVKRRAALGAFPAANRTRSSLRPGHFTAAIVLPGRRAVREKAVTAQRPLVLQQRHPSPEWVLAAPSRGHRAENAAGRQSSSPPCRPGMSPLR
jgi:hypothetical protein